MSIYAVINESEPEFFSSNQGWSDIISWADKLDADKFSEVVHVAEHGYTEQIPELLSQLREAVTVENPGESVMATLNELGDLIADEKGVLLITDGTGPEAVTTQDQATSV